MRCTKNGTPFKESSESEVKFRPRNSRLESSRKFKSAHDNQSVWLNSEERTGKGLISNSIILFTFFTRKFLLELTFFGEEAVQRSFSLDGVLAGGNWFFHSKTYNKHHSLDKHRRKTVHLKFQESSEESFQESPEESSNHSGCPLTTRKTACRLDDRVTGESILLCLLLSGYSRVVERRKTATVRNRRRTLPQASPLKTNTHGRTRFR